MRTIATLFLVLVVLLIATSTTAAAQGPTGCKSTWAVAAGYTDGYFPEGYRHSTGRYVCRGGRWVPIGADGAAGAAALPTRTPEAPAATPPATGGTVYTVKYGDTLGRIASRFGVTVQAIAQANGIANPNYIYPGQGLVIPGTAPEKAPPEPTTAKTGVEGEDAYFTHVVRKGETLCEIALRYSVDQRTIMEFNKMVSPLVHEGQTIRIPVLTETPRPVSVLHKVAWGETLASIAADYGVTVEAVAEKNGIYNAAAIADKWLAPGMVLEIPPPPNK